MIYLLSPKPDSFEFFFRFISRPTHSDCKTWYRFFTSQFFLKSLFFHPGHDDGGSANWEGEEFIDKGSHMQGYE